MFSVLIFLFSMGFHTSADSISSCEAQAARSPIYQGFQDCENMKAAKSAGEAAQAAQSLANHGFCKIGDADPSTTLKEVCANPAGFICSRMKGKVFTPSCQLFEDSNDVAAQTPALAHFNCLNSSAVAGVINAHYGECPDTVGFLPAQDACRQWLKAKYANEIATAQRNLVYTPDRIQRMQDIFKRVKKNMRQIIENSTLIPKNKKQVLLEQIRKTSLDLPVDPDDAEDCTVPGPHGADTGIFNDTSVDKIEICIGAMAQLDQDTDLDLIMQLGHELSHSIDPCTLEEISNGELQGKDFYPGLTQCLHGGTGPDGCTDSILHCNTKEGIDLACKESEKSGVFNEVGCKIQAALKPSCALGPASQPYNLYDLSLYRQESHPIEQIQESFADFLGSQTLGNMMQEDQAIKGLSDAKKLNDFVSVLSDLSQLHGGCITTNTNDQHPSASLRINRIMMGNKSAREAFCGSGAPAPSVPGAGVTCPNL